MTKQPKTINEYDQLLKYERIAFLCNVIREAGIVGLILYVSLWLLVG